MNAPDVSVVIPTFHREKQLREAIDSILAQQGVTFEVIVSDDSAEGTARSVVAQVADPRVLYLGRPEPSKGRPARVRNDGAALARGRYLHFLDDDDMLFPDSLAVLSGALDAAPHAGMAFGAIEPFGEDAEKLAQHRAFFADAQRVARLLKTPRQMSASLIFRPAVLVNSACMARRSTFEAVQGFDATIPICEDADLWARMVDGSAHVFVDRPVVRYRTGAASMMHNLTAEDERMPVSYKIIHDKYRRTHGPLQFLLMKFWARVLLR